MTEPREIAFEDIRKGDDITATHVQAGVIVTRRGVVGYIEGKGLYSAEGGYIGHRTLYTFTLNHRPVPAEPEGLGAVVRAKVYSRPTDPETVRTFVRSPYPDMPWVDDRGYNWHWSLFVPESVEVLREGSYE